MAMVTTQTAGIVERIDEGVLVLSPAERSVRRRVLFVNSYGGADVWRKIQAGNLPPHHLWGCIELVQMGYEVALPEPLRHFEFRHPLPHDLPLLKFALGWLRPDDILYCGHTLLYWLPLLRPLFRRDFHLVSTKYAREELDFARSHRAIIALTPAAADHAKKIAPAARIAHLGWGGDLNYFPRIDFDPRWYLSCGITHRDFPTMREAAALTTASIRLIAPGVPPSLSWPSNVEVIDGGKGWNHEKSVISYEELFHTHYSGSIASMIILKHDPTEYTAIGFTNLIESMAMGRAVVATRTGALPSEIDVEKEGCGLFVPANDPAALGAALSDLASDPARAAEMGKAARRLAESRYNIARYSRDLHALFESL